MSFMNDSINKFLDDFKHNLDPKDCNKTSFHNLLEGVKFQLLKDLERDHSNVSDKITMVDNFIENYKKQEIYKFYCEICISNCIGNDF